MGETGLLTPHLRADVAVLTAQQVFIDPALSREECAVVRSAVLGQEPPGWEAEQGAEAVMTDLAKEAPASIDVRGEGNRTKATGLPTVRAALVRWLMQDPAVSQLLDARGVRARGVRIEGALDVRGVRSGVPLALRHCIASTIAADDAIVGHIDLSGTTMEKLTLVGAIVNGDVTCARTVLTGEGGEAINADHAHIRGNVSFCEETSLTGGVCLQGAMIDGEFMCAAHFTNPCGRALDASLAHFGGAVLLETGASFIGEVCLRGATIDGELKCTARFTNPCGRALDAANARIGASALFDEGASFIGEVRLPGANIGGQLVCRKATLTNTQTNRPLALFADGTEIRADVILEDSSFRGEVRLVGATIGGTLSCHATFDNGSDDALCIADARIRSSVSFIRSIFTGRVNLADATIAGKLEGYPALITVPAAVETEEVPPAPEEVPPAREEVPPALNLARATIGALTLPLVVGGWIDASGTRILGDLSRWPSPPTRLETRGLAYQSIDGGAIEHWHSRVAMLRHQGNELRPGSFDQLAAVYRAAGHAGIARRVLVAKERALTRRGGYSWPRVLWRWLQDGATGYGRAPERALVVALFVILIGACAAAWRIPASQWVIPASRATPQLASAAPPPLHDRRGAAWLYSADTFLPIVDFGEESTRTPRSEFSKAWWLEKTLIMLGWLLTTIIVTAYTAGAVRRDE